MTEDLSLEKAQELLKQASARKLEACNEEMKKVLEKHQCTLQAQIFVTEDGRLGARVAIVPAG